MLVIRVVRWQDRSFWIVSLSATSDRSSRGLLYKVTKMNRALQITVTCVALLVVLPGASFGGLVTEVGDLNIIDDDGNPSNGLRYLDLTFSLNRTLASALANAQATYSNARLATASEWDDLFAAAGITYDALLTPC